MAFQRLSQRVWWYAADPDPGRVRGGVGFIDAPTGGILVDAGQSPGHARDIRYALFAAGLAMPRRLVYTHHHWDHVWGACAWPQVEIIGHTTTVPLLEAEAKRPWSAAYLAEQVAAQPLLQPSFTARAAAMDRWDDFTILTPHTTFTDSLRPAGGIEIRHVGGGHAPDSTIVIDHESSVALVGDCFYPPPHHLREPGDGLDVGMVRTLLAEKFDWYVDSHSPPRSRTAVISEGEALGW